MLLRKYKAVVIFGVQKNRAVSSVGRASRLHRGGQSFFSPANPISFKTQPANSTL